MSRLQNERLKLYLEAEKAVLSGQSYTIGNRTLTRANLATIRKAIDDLLADGALWTRTNAYQRGQEKELSFSDKEDI